MKTNGVFGVRRVSSCTTKSQPTEKHPHSWCFCDSFCCDCVLNWDRSWLYCPSTLELGIEMMPLFLQYHSITRKKKNWERERFLSSALIPKIDTQNSHVLKDITWYIKIVYISLIHTSQWYEIRNANATPSTMRQSNPCSVLGQVSWTCHQASTQLGKLHLDFLAHTARPARKCKSKKRLNRNQSEWKENICMPKGTLDLQ
jgi:hypothetical protein